MAKPDIKLFIAELMNEENDKYAQLMIDLRDEIGETTEFIDAGKVLLQVHMAKIKILEKVYGAV